METTPDASWEQLVAALERMGEEALADQIRSHLSLAAGDQPAADVVKKSRGR